MLHTPAVGGVGQSAGVPHLNEQKERIPPTKHAPLGQSESMVHDIPKVASAAPSAPLSGGPESGMAGTGIAPLQSHAP